MYRKIIVYVAACPHPDPHRHHRFRLLQSVVTICRQIRRLEASRSEPLDYRHAEVKNDRARRNVPVGRPLSPNHLEKKA